MTAAIAIQHNSPVKPMVEFALDYARRGWHVFPCNPSTKAPYIGSGFKNASTDPAIIAQWWRQWPRAMIGVRMGTASGVWAIDPDAPKPPANIDGRQNWINLTQKNGAGLHTH